MQITDKRRKKIKKKSPASVCNRRGWFELKMYDEVSRHSSHNYYSFQFILWRCLSFSQRLSDIVTSQLALLSASVIELC